MRTPLGPAREEMFTTAYWTEDSGNQDADSRHPGATDLLMDEAAIRDLNVAILTDPASRRTDVHHMDLPDLASRDAFVTYNLTRPEYAEVAPMLHDSILEGLSAFGKDYGLGVCIARSVLLSLPIEGEWPTYKPYTLSPIHVNEGVIIYSMTADEKWYFVRSAIYYGWVSSSCIALADSREEMKRCTDYEDFLVVTADHLTVVAEEDPVVSHSSRGADNQAGGASDNSDVTTITYDMGDRIRLVAHDARGYHVTVFLKDGSGHVAAADTIIDESEGVHVGYLPYTQKNLLDQCFKTLDDRYMWGGGEGERDCSSWIMEIFSCFGIVFPRNSARQAKIPAYSLNLSGIDNEIKSEILSRLPVGTLIFSPSHVMVYLGRRGNDNYMIHNGGDFCVINDTCESTDQSTDRSIDRGADWGTDRSTDRGADQGTDRATSLAIEKYLTYGVTVMSLEKTTTLGGRVWQDAIISAVFPQTSDKYSILVNKTHAFDEHYLGRVTMDKRMSVDGDEKAIETETSKALDELIAFADTMGIRIGLCSAYRSIAYQQKMLDTYPEIYGDGFRPEIIAPPGYSEHHTGLAVDLAIYWGGRWVEDNYPDEAMADLEKLHPYVHRFGFILRYPDGLEDITGYPYEPWHLRYVGKSAAPAYFISGRHLPFEALTGGGQGDGSPVPPEPTFFQENRHPVNVPLENP